MVRSGGTVKFPGEYPLTENMAIDDLVTLSGGLIASAYSQSAEISRSSLQDPNRAKTSIVVSDLSRSQPTRLEPSDYAEFRTIPEFRESQIIRLEGEVGFPGTYVFERGETLSSVIERAGGFTDEAFVDGSVFLRESLRLREQEEIDRLLTLLSDELSVNTPETQTPKSRLMKEDWRHSEALLLPCKRKRRADWLCLWRTSWQGCPKTLF